jgi:hypothetical protein
LFGKQDMTTAILQEFRRRFVASSLREETAPTTEADTLDCLKGLDSTKLFGQVLLLGSLSQSTLREAARLAGPKSVVLYVVPDWTKLSDLRNRVVAERVDDAATITPVCADWTDLRCDVEWIQRKLHAQPLRGVSDLRLFEDELAAHTQANPLISDCSTAVAMLPALNAVPPEQVSLVLEELARVLENLGRLTLTCLVSDESLSTEDASLLPDCQYLPTEQELLNLLERAGFYGIEVTHWDEFPHRLIGTIEVRRVQVRAFKGKQGPCFECFQAVIYRGPWKSVHDDDGHVYNRGERTAVCEKTYGLLTHEPYRNDFIPVPPYADVPVETAAPFDCQGVTIRHPKVTKSSHAPESATVISECAGDCAC